mmetsp:Transcript_12212/g.42874  ORF Transcript_12212/g.42874 Transcript_12212/m.42874 type:complete len:239 (-) Transcript_12212:2095-2811(-)
MFLLASTVAHLASRRLRAPPSRGRLLKSILAATSLSTTSQAAAQRASPLALPPSAEPFSRHALTRAAWLPSNCRSCARVMVPRRRNVTTSTRPCSSSPSLHTLDSAATDACAGAVSNLVNNSLRPCATSRRRAAASFDASSASFCCSDTDVGLCPTMLPWCKVPMLHSPFPVVTLSRTRKRAQALKSSNATCHIATKENGLARRTSQTSRVVSAPNRTRPEAAATSTACSSSVRASEP